MAKINPNSKAPFNITHENMIRAVVAFALNAANVAITNSVAAFAAIINLISGNVTTINSLRASIAQPIKGYADQKKAIKVALAAMSANIMKSVLTYANDTGDQVLAAQMQISQSDLLAMKYVDMVNFVQGAINIVNPIMGMLPPYNVTPSTVSVWQSLQAQLDTLISNPKNAIANRKQVNENIQLLLRQSMVLLYNNADELAFQFRPANLNYYNNYRANRRLYPHSMSTQLRISVFTSLAHPATGEVFIVGTDRSGVLDAIGYVLIDHIPFGTDDVSITTPQGDYMYGPYDFKKGKSLTLDIQLPPTTDGKSTVKMSEEDLVEMDSTDKTSGK